MSPLDLHAAGRLRQIDKARSADAATIQAFFKPLMATGWTDSAGKYLTRTQAVHAIAGGLPICHKDSGEIIAIPPEVAAICRRNHPKAVAKAPAPAAALPSPADRARAAMATPPRPKPDLDKLRAGIARLKGETAPAPAPVAPTVPRPSEAEFHKAMSFATSSPKAKAILESWASAGHCRRLPNGSFRLA